MKMRRTCVESIITAILLIALAILILYAANARAGMVITSKTTVDKWPYIQYDLTYTATSIGDTEFPYDIHGYLDNFMIIPDGTNPPSTGASAFASRMFGK